MGQSHILCHSRHTLHHSINIAGQRQRLIWQCLIGRRKSIGYGIRAHIASQDLVIKSLLLLLGAAGEGVIAVTQSATVATFGTTSAFLLTRAQVVREAQTSALRVSWRAFQASGHGEVLACGPRGRFASSLGGLPGRS
eukprot:2490246-Amphidinium_carterae.1